MLHATANGVKISDCIFLNNKATSSTGYIISSDTSNRVTADNNWWGNTLNNQKTRPGAYSGVIVSNWYFLNIESNSTKMQFSVKDKMSTICRFFAYKIIV